MIWCPGYVLWWKKRKKKLRLIILTFWYLFAAHHKFGVLMNSFYLNLNAAPSLPMLMISKKDWPLFDAFDLENLEQNLVGCKFLQKVICVKMPRVLVALFVLYIFYLWEKKCVYWKIFWFCTCNWFSLHHFWSWTLSFTVLFWARIGLQEWVVERPRTLKLPPYPTGEANITSIHEENKKSFKHGITCSLPLILCFKLWFDNFCLNILVSKIIFKK
jgi:hypothetical protein